jgi:excinuclease ABC subunit C
MNLCALFGASLPSLCARLVRLCYNKIAMEQTSETQSKLTATVKNLPRKPGVYIMKDEAGRVIYVGKAINLRNRVRSYFQSPGGLQMKTRRLVSTIEDLEYIVTASELEALILECTLIKKHRPFFNVRLRDDKNYLYIKITLNEEWPRVFTTRRVEKDGAKYFGPYASAKSVRATLELLNRLFPYRTCDRTITGKDRRACLYLYMHRCLGPCIGVTTKAEYDQAVRQAIQFLEGKHEGVVNDLTNDMNAAADGLNFERAAALRDKLQAISRVAETQRVVSATYADQDVIAFARSDGEACVQLFFIRGGRLIGRENYVLEGTNESEDREVLGSFLEQFYESAQDIPPKILLPNEVDEMRIIESWLRSKRGTKVSLTVPRQGEGKQLVEMAAENASETLAQLRALWLADSQKTMGAVLELQEYLDLTTAPLRIECYDISNIQGTSPVGSMVVFENGAPKNAHYRRFKIKTVQGANDYAMMQEVLRRRFKRASLTGAEKPPADERTADEQQAESAAETAASNEVDPWTIMPNLVIIDGGKGQLNAALEVLDDLGVTEVPTVGLAKEHEEIFTRGCPDPIILPRTSQALYLVQRIRDEAHRFAITYHKKIRQKKGMRSLLDEVRGIGPRRKAALLKRFGNVQAIRDASIDDVAAVPGMTRAAAQRLKEML